MYVNSPIIIGIDQANMTPSSEENASIKYIQRIPKAQSDLNFRMTKPRPASAAGLLPSCDQVYDFNVDDCAQCNPSNSSQSLLAAFMTMTMPHSVVQQHLQ
mmetsp:Transcript_17153/g.26868  ORF Transcript_17153/g.26868 Transcript_17153/m.26868 type:complete len:101 (-) Transcript_17153:415-717(-)